MCISFAKAHCQAFELATTTEWLQVGGGLIYSTYKKLFQLNNNIK